MNTSEKLNELIRKISTMNVCAGHPEKRFLEICKSRKDEINNHSGDVVAFRDDYCPITLHDELYCSTIRSTKCELLVNDVKCCSCKHYRGVLRSMHTRALKQDSEKNSHVSSHTNYRYLKTPERRKRMRQLKDHLDQSRRVIETLKSKLQQLQEEHSVNIDEPLKTDLEGIMEESTSKVHETYPPGSFLYFETSNYKQWRLRIVASLGGIQWWWNGVLTWNWSGRTYNALRSTLVLPSERTLRDYTHYYESKPRFDDELDKQLMKEAQVDTIQDFQKYVCLVLDEVRVKEGLVYDKHSLQVIGFVNLGDINNFSNLNWRRLVIYRKLILRQLRNTLGFMVRGIFSKLEFLYVQFPCTSISGDKCFLLYGSVLSDFKHVV